MGADDETHNPVTKSKDFCHDDPDEYAADRSSRCWYCRTMGLMLMPPRRTNTPILVQTATSTADQRRPWGERCPAPASIHRLSETQDGHGTRHAPPSLRPIARYGRTGEAHHRAHQQDARSEEDVVAQVPLERGDAADPVPATSAVEAREACKPWHRMTMPANARRPAGACTTSALSGIAGSA